MSIQHTQGPWACDDWGCVFQSTDTGPGRVVGSVSSAHVETADEFHANARLFAAAPELLEALRTARACIQTDRTNVADSHMQTHCNELDEDGVAAVAEYDAVLQQIDAAIKRATEGR